jgi:hypothetical protein
MRFKPDLDEETRLSLSKEDWIDLSWYTLERESEAYTTYMFKDYKDYVSEMQRMMKPLLENDVLRGDPHISLVSTAAAKELRDCYFAPMVRKFVGLSTDVEKVLKYPRVGL